MDFVDHRKSPETQTQTEAIISSRARRRGKMLNDYIEEIIQEAQQRGEFDNLSGTGKPLNRHHMLWLENPTSHARPPTAAARRDGYLTSTERHAVELVQHASQVATCNTACCDKHR